MADITCARCTDLLGDYVGERLSPEDHAAMNAHFLACRRCRILLASYRAIPEIVRRATDIHMPSGVRARLRRFLRRKDK